MITIATAAVLWATGATVVGLSAAYHVRKLERWCGTLRKELTLEQAENADLRERVGYWCLRSSQTTILLAALRRANSERTAKGNRTRKTNRLAKQAETTARLAGGR